MSNHDEVDWNRAKGGDGRAFGEIFDRHRARIHRHAHGLAPTPSDADDVVAITFLEAWRKRDAIRFVDGSILPWLLRTATYTTHNLNRSSRRHRLALERLPPGEPHPDVSDQFDDGEALAAMRRMSSADQQVLTLCVIEGLTADEAAQVLSIRVGTVKSRLSRAKERLRRTMGGTESGVPRAEGVIDVL